MRGLLGRPVHTRNTGLLGLLGAPIPADAGDEMFLRRYAERGSELPPVAALSAKADGGKTGAMSQAIPGGGPQRPRVSPWRVLDAVLGGSTITEGIDAERARLQTPQNDPMQARLLKIAESMGPTALAAYGTNPEEFGAALASNLEGYTLGAGGIRGGIDGVIASAPTSTTVNDTIYSIDPAARQATALVTAPPGYDDTTQRQRVEADVALGQQRLGLDRYRADVDAAVGLGNLGIAQEELGLKRDETRREQEEAARAQQAQASEVIQTADNMAGALQRSREFVRSAGVWSQYNPLNRQARANLEGNLDTIRGNLTFDKLMEMKANSPTGASGLGALSDNEARLLASTAASLSADMSPQELERSFQVIDGLIAKMRDTSGAPAQGRVVSVSSPQEAAALPPGTRYRAPNGRVYIRE